MFCILAIETIEAIQLKSDIQAALSLMQLCFIGHLYRISIAIQFNKLPSL